MSSGCQSFAMASAFRGSEEGEDDESGFSSAERGEEDQFFEDQLTTPVRIGPFHVRQGHPCPQPEVPEPIGIFNSTTATFMTA